MNRDTDRKNEETPDGASRPVCAEPSWERWHKGMPVVQAGPGPMAIKRLQGGAAAFVTAQRGNARWHEPGTTARRGPQSTTGPHGSRKAS